METQNYNYQDPNVIQLEEGRVAKKFFAQVFLWMFVALSLSAVSAYIFISNPSFISGLVSLNEAGEPTGLSGLGFAVQFAPLILVLTMSFALSKLSYPALIALFVGYSVTMGLSLSFLLMRYSTSSIVVCFISAAAIFGLMAFMGYTTNVDLTKFGSLLFIGLIGLIIASVINMFMGSSTMEYILSFLGVAIFTGLTAYDVQKIKRFGQGYELSGETELHVDAKKAGIIAALTLYLDFINIFIYLLRIFGDRRN
ncbi:MAG: Bax inhibitor-1/YccA family protein [Pedobacter sp.]|nr:MAG: Bax inhibitor-1/YccA family protein [Pedobacter sp.]